jgi:lysophospholipase L1-like esterase
MTINNSKSTVFAPRRAWLSRSLTRHLGGLALGWGLVCSGLALAEDPPAGPLSVRPVIQDAEWAVQWWMPRHEEKLREKANLKNCQLVWIGDSITHGWEGEGKELWKARYAQYDALNLGFSGDRTEHVLWRLQHGAVDGLSPKLVVMMIGTNNAGHRKEASAETAQGIRAIIADLRKRLPESKILLLGVFPRGENRDDELRKLCVKTNELIADAADGDRVVYLDISPKFLDDAGNLSAEIMPDKLHPNLKGYEIWAQAIDKQLTSMLK